LFSALRWRPLPTLQLWRAARRMERAQQRSTLKCLKVN
jgi:hypothetical protein